MKRVIAYVFGSRSQKTLKKLLKKLSRFNVVFWCTDNFNAYNMSPVKYWVTQSQLKCMIKSLVHSLNENIIFNSNQQIEYMTMKWAKT